VRLAEQEEESSKLTPFSPVQPTAKKPMRETGEARRRNKKERNCM